MIPLLAVGGAMALGKLALGLFQGHKANKIHPVYNPYQTSPYALQQLGLAQQMFNGRMPGAADIEHGINTSQANYLHNIGENATDSAQALALGGLSQGVSNDAYNRLGIQEEQYKQQMLGNLNNAYGTMINEGDKKYQDMWNKYQMDAGVKAATKQAAWQNMFSGMSDLGSMGVFGAYDGLFKKTPGTTPSQLDQVKIGAGPSWMNSYQDQIRYPTPWNGVLGVD